MSDNKKRERFGRYLILDHLVDGGMAKICRARFLGEQADKVVAIKMVQPQYSKDEAFKTMFMDEIKLTFGLLHPNIIQTYDYGLNNGQLFVAMEYCDGRNLKEYLEKLKERKFVFPVEISTYIISQACQGLYYAHTFRDKLTGEEAHIIHRDISPHNIMLTYDGSIKIIDFGIAKSQKSSEATQAGTIKGKLSYLAPEYLEGMELDPRYDQFALGITLWEMLCSRKLFKENNDLAVLKKIQECKIPPPSSINPNVPKELDEIVLKSLSKDRNKRYENLDQMNRALMKFLYSKFPDFNSTDLSYFAQELFRDEIKKDREKLFEYGKIDIRPYLDDVKNDADGVGKNSKGDNQVENEELQAPKKPQVLDFGFEIEDDNKRSRLKTATVKKAPKDNSSTTNAFRFPQKEKTDSQIINLRNTTASNNLSTETKSKNNLDKKEKTATGIKNLNQVNKNTKANKKSKLAVASIAVAIFGVGLLAFKFNKKNNLVAENQNSKMAAKEVKGPRPASESHADEANEKGTLSLTHFDRQKMQVFVDGVKEEVDIYSNIKVPVQKDFILRVQIEGRKHFIKNIRVNNTAAMEVEIPEMPVIPYGFINTSSSCAKGEISFELWGEKRISAVPVFDTFGIPLPLEINERGEAIPTKHIIYYKEETEGIERKIEINLTREDETIDLCEKI